MYGSLVGLGPDRGRRERASYMYAMRTAAWLAKIESAQIASVENRPGRGDFRYPVCHMREAFECGMSRRRAVGYGSRKSSSLEVYTLKDRNLVPVVACGVECEIKRVAAFICPSPVLMSVSLT